MARWSVGTEPEASKKKETYPAARGRYVGREMRPQVLREDQALNRKWTRIGIAAGAKSIDCRSSSMWEVGKRAIRGALDIRAECLSWRLLQELRWACVHLFRTG